MSRPLSQHKKTLESASPEKTLRILTEIWRNQPGTPLADAICALSEHVPQTEAGEADLPKLLLRKSPEDLTQALLFILAGTTKQAIERIDLLMEWPQDPRIDRWMYRLLIDPPFQAIASQPFFRKAYTWIRERAGDHALLEQLNGLGQKFLDQNMGHNMSRWFEAQNTKLRTAIEKQGIVEMPLTPAEARIAGEPN